MKRTVLCLFILGLSFHSLRASGRYWVPVDPPKSYYQIDATVDLEKGSLEGSGWVTFENPGPHPITVLAFDWSLAARSTLKVRTEEGSLILQNPREGRGVSSPLYFRLPAAVDPGSKVRVNFTYSRKILSRGEREELATTRWFPRLWWNGIPVHDAFSVKVNIPEGYALAVSGRRNPTTGRFEVDGARTFGVYLRKGLETASREVDGVQITAFFTEKGAPAALACLETAADAVKYYKDWLGFYPYDFLNIIPGGSGRWGGYPFATGIVAIHGEETFQEGEPLTHWQRITAHEIGHEYWGEWVMDPDHPAWLWIGLGIFADTAYILDRKVDTERRRTWMAQYLKGLSRHYDTTIDLPPHLLPRVAFDRNNIVTHSKGFAVISALDALLGRERFDRIYRKALVEYGG
ncbi:MAG: hypothetical protein ACE5LV_11090, partial [Candidatus Aminicenantales bacterium]